MRCVLDASVFLAYAIPEEKQHGESARFFGRCDLEGHSFLMPTLALPEVAGGVARRKRDSARAELALGRLIQIPRLKFVPISDDLADKAAKLASRYFLRGADALYAEIARQNRLTLVTYDLELQERLKGEVEVKAPGLWLA